MALPQATTTLLDKVKTALRVSTTDADITQQISDIIDEAKLDLSKTADISASALQNPDALIEGAIKAYAAYVWCEEDLVKMRLKQCYDDYKAKLAMSSEYSTYEEADSDEES
jgi:hypothetical protein